MTDTFSRFGLLAVVSIATGCASVREEMAEDRTQMQQTLRSRLGVAPEIPLIREDYGALAPEVCPLLCDGLTEEEAIKVVFLNNRGIWAEMEELGIARSELVQAGLLTNPVFNANAKFFNSGTEIEIGIAQSFLDLFYRPLRKRVAEAEFAAAQAAVASRVIGVVYEVRRIFVTLRAAQQVSEMRQQVMQAARASFELMRDLHKAGNVTDPQLTIEEAALSRAKLHLAAAEVAVYEAKESLNSLLGLWGEEIPWQVEGRMEEDAGAGIAWEGLESKAVAASLDLAHNRAHAEAAAQRAGLSSWEGWMSGWELGVVAKHEAADDEWGVGPSLSLPLPLFSQGQAHVAGAQARLRQVLYRHVELAVQLRSTARTFRERLIALRSRVNYLRKAYLPLQARLVHETLQNYNAMQIGAFDVLLARQQQIDAGREYIETLRDAWLARLDLEELLAGRLNPSRLASSPSAPSEHEGGVSRKKGH